MRRWIHCLPLLAMFVSPVALAQDEDPLFGEEDDEDIFGESEESDDTEDDDVFDEEDDEDLFGEGEESETSGESGESGQEDVFSEDEDIDFEDEEEAKDLLEGEESAEERLQQEGVDSAEIYRAQVAEVKGSAPDEEIMAWEAYLEDYPNSLFRDTIQARIDTLVGAQFNAIDGLEEQRVDAASEEIRFVSPVLMGNLNPRTRFHANIEFGIPGYFGTNVDFEYAFKRNISLHGGLAGRFNGLGVEIGPRWAFVKSTRHQLVATLIGDVRVNLDPLYFAFRPQLGVAKIWGPVQLHAYVGTEVEARQFSTPAVLGGLSISGRVADSVGLFAETQLYFRGLGSDNDAGYYSFNNVVIGLRFFFGDKKGNNDPFEMALAGGMPYQMQYLGAYQANVMGQFDYYFNDK